MKSLAELSAIRDKMKSKVALREETGETRIVVGMEVMEKHIKGGKPVVEYTIGNIEK